ncbi:MAG: 3-isopropylmalate dehydratase small subunit [Roseomonas sp.]|nr:3-isopropylmalate dehydratase small subunit [Roseomonas sp.]MCA3305986.1 3-isopropylmalate dehydratase small subunit [Roseomonas sp.]
MEPFISIRSNAVPLVQSNIDTDQIIPARFLARPRDDDHGINFFRDLRFDAAGNEIPEFPLNRAGWRDARIILGGRNFACGSSRENAVWALHGWGARAVIAPSFGDIFAINAVKNGVLPIILLAEAVSALMAASIAAPEAEIAIDLPEQTVTAPDGTVHRFEIDPFAKRSLLEGLDELAFTMTHEDDIAAFERRFGRDNF